MLNPFQSSLLTPHNDGESVVIIEIARRLGLDVRVSEQPWGATLDKEPAESFINAKENVIIAEIPGIKKEADLAQHHTLFIIDHHKYDDLDRTNPKSSLEQFAKLFGHTLNRWESGVALNDRGYIPALEANGYTQQEIEKLRRFDLTAQGYRESDFQALQKEYNGGRVIGDSWYVVETKRVKTSYISDLHFWTNRANGVERKLLILSQADDGKVHKASFSGTPAVARELFRRLGGYCGGDEAKSMYWGIEFAKHVGTKEALDTIVG